MKCIYGQAIFILIGIIGMVTLVKSRELRDVNINSANKEKSEIKVEQNSQNNEDKSKINTIVKKNHQNDGVNGPDSKIIHHLSAFDRKNLFVKDSYNLEKVFRQKFYQKTTPVYRINEISTNSTNNITSENSHHSNKTNSIPSEKKNTFKFLPSNNENIEKIDNQTSKIIQNICSSEKDINLSLQNLKKEFNNISEKIKKIEHSTSNKHELILKYTQVIQEINYGRSSLIRIEDLISTLKLSNCEKYEETYREYSLVHKNSDDLIENLKKCFKKENLKMDLLVLN